MLDQQESARRIHQKARDIRGGFLNSVAVIEWEIASILKDYFCTSDEEKQKIFLKYIMGGRGITLEIKKQILFRILEDDYPRYWKSHEATLRIIDKIIQFRNKLAHSIVDVSSEALARPLEEGIGFVEWKGGEPISEEIVDDWSAKTSMFLSHLADLRLLLPFKERNADLDFR